MKAIKDCEWEVSIIPLDLNYRWQACTHDTVGFLSSTFDYRWLSSKQSAKRNWEKFAKLNGIKKWKYV